MKLRAAFLFVTVTVVVLLGVYQFEYIPDFLMLRGAPKVVVHVYETESSFTSLMQPSDTVDGGVMELDSTSSPTPAKSETRSSCTTVSDTQSPSCSHSEVPESATSSPTPSITPSISELAATPVNNAEDSSEGNKKYSFDVSLPAQLEECIIAVIRFRSESDISYNDRVMLLEKLMVNITCTHENSEFDFTRTLPMISASSTTFKTSFYPDASTEQCTITPVALDDSIFLSDTASVTLPVNELPARKMKCYQCDRKLTFRWISELTVGSSHSPIPHSDCEQFSIAR